MEKPETHLQIVSLIKSFEEKSILKKINEIIDNFPNLKDKFQLKTGRPEQVPNHILITFDVPFSKAFEIIKSLVIEGVPIISEVPIIKKAIKEALYEIQLRKVEAVHKMKKKKEASADKETNDQNLEEIIETGDWKTLIKIAKNKSIKNAENSKKILEILPEIIKKIIAYEMKRDFDKLSRANLSFERLVEIATNIDLKILRFFSIMSLAGEAALEICLKFPKEMVSELIILMNNENTSPHVKINSFLSFYEIIKENTTLYSNDIIYAAKNINTRSLNTSIHSAFNLSNRERIQFREAIDFFSDLKRTGKIAS